MKRKMPARNTPFCDEPGDEHARGDAMVPTGAKSYPCRHGEIQTSRSNRIDASVRPYLRGTKDA